MKYEDNPHSIKYFVKKYLIENKNHVAGKTVVDFPAGNGVTARILSEVGAIPIPMDLFPEYFNIENIECVRANICNGLPIKEKAADMLICQEGIEHFSDQYGALKEFNRVLKNNGILLITTPNYSNLKAKMSYLLSESERYNSIMPPNELDSIWMSQQAITTEIYFGHIFVIGIQKLRVLAKLAGFKIKKLYPTKIKTTSLLLFPFLYPFIYLSNWITFKKNMKKNKNWDLETKKQVYNEVFKLAVNPQILIRGHLMIEFVKEKDFENVAESLRSEHKEFGAT